MTCRNALEDFKSNQAETAIQQFSSIEKYTEEMKHNLEHFSEIMDEWYSQVPEEMLKEDNFIKLASHKGEDVASEPVQSIVEEIIASIQTTTSKLLVGSAENYCRMMIDTYSNDYLSKVFDTKHGTGSSEYIVKAFRYYSENNCTKNN